MNFLRRSYWIVALVLATAGTYAQTLPLVEVRFRVNVVEFRQPFGWPATTNELQQFEADTARLLETVLTRHFGFLRFGPGTNANIMSVSVEGGEATTLVAQTYLAIQLKAGTNSPRVMQPRWKLRATSEPVVPERFGLEIASVMHAMLEAGRDVFIQDLLSGVSLANEVYFVPPQATNEKAHCILPFSYGAIEAEPNDTRFEFETRSGGLIPTPLYHGASGIDTPASILTNLPAIFADGIVAVEEPAAIRMAVGRAHVPWLQVSTNSGPVRGQALYVTGYRRRLETALPSHSPSSISF